MSESIDVARELAALRERVRGLNVPSNAELTPLQKAVSAVNLNWYVSARLPPPAPKMPRRFYLLYFLKRVVRRVLYEVLNTVIEQQNTFNAEVARAVTELAKENAQLRARIQELEQRAAADEQA